VRVGKDRMFKNQINVVLLALFPLFLEYFHDFKRDMEDVCIVVWMRL
jgi:hypothetical protein